MHHVHFEVYYLSVDIRGNGSLAAHESLHLKAKPQTAYTRIFTSITSKKLDRRHKEISWKAWTRTARKKYVTIVVVQVTAGTNPVYIAQNLTSYLPKGQVTALTGHLEDYSYYRYY